MADAGEGLDVTHTGFVYKTPEGASMLSKQPALMQATMQVLARHAKAPG